MNKRGVLFVQFNAEFTNFVSTNTHKKRKTK